ncbi:MAG: helix-turn-helix transcriptional regulator [Bacilli bacterium]
MRNDQKLTQKQLAHLLKVDQTTLSGWERGYREPVFENIEKIASICHYKITFINELTKEAVDTKNIFRKE